MKPRSYFFLAVIVLLITLLTGCFGPANPGNNPTPTPVLTSTPTPTSRLLSTNVYVSGVCMDSSGLYVPCYWRNGVRTDLSLLDSTKGGDTGYIYVSGNDVYVAGATGNSSNIGVPCIWVNGNRTDLPALDSSKGGHASSVAVSGGTIYVAGVCINSSNVEVPYLWVNNIGGSLPVLDSTRDGQAGQLQIINGHVYIMGESKNSSGQWVACYWEDGVRTDLYGTGLTESFASKMAISGTTKYITGSGSAGPGYWQDGVWHDLDVIDGSISAIAGGIAISDSNIYIAGFCMNSEAVNVPCYWLNGTRYSLPIPASFENGYAYDAVAFGTDIYINGNATSSNAGTVFYWKNGTLNPLPLLDPSKGGRTNTIFVINQ